MVVNRLPRWLPGKQPQPQGAVVNRSRTADQGCDRSTDALAPITLSEPVKALPASEKESSNAKTRFLRQPGYFLMRRRILVVDDDTSVRESLARVLEEQDYDVIVAATAREAVSVFLAGSPDLVLLD